MQLNLISAEPEEKLRIVAPVIPIWKEKKTEKPCVEEKIVVKNIQPLFDNQRVFRTPKYDYL